jgi:hypothetical protein
MKKLFIGMILVSLFLTNCTKNLEFSCDPLVNQWVVDNNLKYANISRPEFSQFSFEQQIGLYRSFKGKQKIKLWNEKLNYLLTTQNLSEDEKAYLLKLFSFVKPFHFDDPKGKIEFKKFASEWEKDVRSKLGWGDKKVFLYTNILLTIEEFETGLKKRELEKAKSVSNLKSPASVKPPDCGCYYSISCGYAQVCVDGSCNKTDGCGILGTSNCTGLCK